MGFQQRHFDPVKKRCHLLAQSGVAMNLNADFHAVRRDKSLTGWGESMVSEGIQCLLVSLPDLGYQVLQKGMEWLTVANEEREVPRIYDPAATEGSRHFHVGIANWLLDGRHDAYAMRQYADYTNRYLATQTKLMKLEVASYMPEYLAAGAYEDLLALFEKFPSLPRPSLDKPPRRVSEVAYAIASSRLGKEFSSKPVYSAMEKLFRTEIPKLLGNHPVIWAASWMKAAQPSGVRTREDALKALLNCYKYLPEGSQPN